MCDCGNPGLWSRRCLREPCPAVHPGLHSHYLRCTYETMLIMLGVPDILQNGRLGYHPSAAPSVYAQATPPMRTAMLEGLDRIYREQWRRG